MIVFPSNPTLNQVHTVGGRSWQWNGTAWQSISNPVAWVDIADKPTVFPPSTHQHSIAEVTGLQAALDGRVLNGGGASTISVMTQAAYTALPVKDNNTIYILT
jgi:hypothetical protein